MAEQVPGVSRLHSFLGLRSVQAKILAFVVPLVLVSTFAVFALFEWNAQNSAQLQLQAKLEKLVRIQSAVIAESLWNVADQQIKLILIALITDPDVIAAAVLDDRDDVIAEVGDTAALGSSRFSAQNDIMYRNGDENIQIGVLKLALTDNRLSELTKERLRLAVFLASILLSAVIAAVLAANRKVIGKPLSLLLESINSAQSDKPRHSVDWSSNDEIGSVVAAFNDLQQRQIAYEQKLQSTNDELEDRVRERTSGLLKAQSEAHEIRNQLTDAIESISEGFALFDLDDLLVVANSRYREIMTGSVGNKLRPGASYQEVAEIAAASERFPAAAEDPEGWVERQITRHKTASAPFIQEMVGNQWQQISNRRTDEGGTVAVHSDITEIKRISDELKRAKDAAEAANEAKSSFLATMSHEIRTPLNGIIGMSTLLSGSKLNAEQRDFSATISMAAETLLTIINDILDFSKVEAGALELESTPMDLAETIESSVELLASKAAEKGIELACRIDNDVPTGLIGDPVRLKQILMNLLSNAIKFTDNGEVVLSVSSMVADAKCNPGDTTLLRFTVRDTGIGIPEDRMHRLFKSFSQVDASTTRRFGGTGLGLVITKRLIELMGGDIGVESEMGRGTTFTFNLPGEVALLPDRGTREEQLDQLKGNTVLIVDDNRTNRLILNEKLRSWEMIPTATESPLEALDLIKSNDDYGVYIIDYKMPEMNGLELARSVRDLKGAKSPPMILFSSISMVDEHFRKGIKEIGFSSVLTKPSRSGQLLSALVAAIHPDEVDNLSSESELNPGSSLEAEDLHILLVDDNMINRKVGKKILNGLGFSPVVVSSGEEAIKSCLAGEFDVVLMDIEMPDMDGIAATARLREVIPMQEMPYVIALTANAMSTERERYLDSGMDDYLSKPIDIPALIDCLKTGGAHRAKQRRTGEAACATESGETG
ncbi:MAG: response regulator [Rhodothermales bacterium]|nr:response regulator [Rhodothermales bacterium]